MKLLASFISIFFCHTFLVSSSILKPHEVWWHNSVIDQKQQVAAYGLYGPINAYSRIIFRHYLKKCNYESMLDIPCGFCTEYAGLQQDNIAITYYGIDIAQPLVELAQEKGLMVVHGSIEDIPYPDSYVDLCYARHIFEHIPSYEIALNELMRVARKEVLIIFSLKPTINADQICLWHGIYFNRYNKNALECFCKNNLKVSHLVWQEVNGQEIILHIYLCHKHS